MQRNNLLWLLAVLIYGVGDALTTYLNISAGLRELNPLINYQTLIPVKFSTIALLYAMSRKYSLKLTPVMLIIAGILCTLWNLNLLINLI